MQRIEFCFFDAGGGHRAAATALQMSIQAQERSWDVRLLNIQELLDELDILKRYAGIRIEDYYNWMLRSGWTLGSVYLMKVLQFAIWSRHAATVRVLVRVDRRSGTALACALRAAQAIRTARKDSGVVRLQLDPAELL